LTFDAKLTAQQVADLTGKSRQTIQAWYNEGLPRSPTTRQLIAFVIGRDEQRSTGSKRQQLAAAQAEKFELENARRRGELVLAADADARLAQIGADLIGQLEGLPGRLANELAGITDAGIIRERLLAECRAIRVVLADSPGKVELEAEDGPQLAAADDAAAPADADRVGGGELPHPKGKRRTRSLPKRKDAVPRAHARGAPKVSKARGHHGQPDGQDDRVLPRHRPKTRR
jgi:transcriptional regulator with XRE-family HTH domain